MCPASCQRPGSTALPDQHALPPRPSSPLQIVNDLDEDDNLTYPSSYRHLSVEARYPAYSLSWFIMQRPSLHICKGLLVELVLTYKETILTTRACLAKISHAGPTWVHF
ncbi:hypothetical protein EWM64_g9997 [Hericium alpestre]|uniref:Uncharacterized protein n=1 Tax=Hericium alpestre TaxID=135208 RepID=A0A4Y9ZGZ8_9AGAM|nr:hypothetical protein EWM64_g9997 [Hericium alpestre]